MPKITKRYSKKDLERWHARGFNVGLVTGCVLSSVIWWGVTAYVAPALAEYGPAMPMAERRVEQSILTLDELEAVIRTRDTLALMELPTAAHPVLHRKPAIKPGTKRLDPALVEAGLLKKEGGVK